MKAAIFHVIGFCLTWATSSVRKITPSQIPMKLVSKSQLTITNLADAALQRGPGVLRQRCGRCAERRVETFHSTSLNLCLSKGTAVKLTFAWTPACSDSSRTFWHFCTWLSLDQTLCAACEINAVLQLLSSQSQNNCYRSLWREDCHVAIAIFV